MTSKDLQEEELEVLRSIYYGDDCFKELSATSFQYRIGENEDAKSFLLEFCWVENYPNCVPEMNLNAFYNNHIVPEVKDNIISRLKDEAELQLGTAMTYTLIEWAKEHCEKLMEAQPEKHLSPESSLPDIDAKCASNEQTVQTTKAEKKPKLSKQQKRRLYNQLDSKGERPRGWNWVDVVKHLSQVGPKKSTNEASGGIS